MGTTPTYVLPYPELTDVANVPADMRELAEAVEAAVGVGVAPSRAARLKTATQALTTAGAWYVVTYEADEGSKDFTYSAGVFTVGKAGLYSINVAQHFLVTGATNPALRISVGAVNIAMAVVAGASAAVTLTIPRTWRLAAGDLVKVEANSSAAGGSAYGVAGTRYSYIDLTRIGF